MSIIWWILWVFVFFSNKIHTKTSKKCGHLLYGGVDWNYNYLLLSFLDFLSPPIRRCGLKLMIIKEKLQLMSVTSYTEVWIEIIPTSYCCKYWYVTSYTEVWIEIYSQYSNDYKIYYCHLLYGGVDWNS